MGVAGPWPGVTVPGGEAEGARDQNESEHETLRVDGVRDYLITEFDDGEFT